MDNFTVSTPLFEEIESLNSFLVEDFERTWGSLDLSNLSEDEKSMQADFNFNMEVAAAEDKSPMLSSALINDAPMFSVNTIEPIDGLTFSIMEPFGEESSLVLDPNMIMTTEVSKKEESNVANVVEDIKYIHSYSLPLENKPEEDVKPNVAEIKPKIRQVQAGRVTKRKRKPVRKFDDSSDDDSDAEFQGHKQVSSGPRKVKLYQMSEFKDDPVMEQKRQNAINAKVNRDRKKKEKNALTSQMKVLRDENKSLNKKNKKYRSRLSSLEKRLEIMEAVISSHGLNSALKASGKKGSSPTSSSSSSEDEEAVYYASDWKCKQKNLWLSDFTNFFLSCDIIL